MKRLFIVFMTILPMVVFCQKKSALQFSEVHIAPYGVGDNNLYNLLLEGTYAKEYVEVFNSSPCDSLDVGCYILASNMGQFGSDMSENKGAFTIPEGTIIPPLGRLTIGGEDADVDIKITSEGAICGLDSMTGVFPRPRWYMRDMAGWMAVYSPEGAPVQAIYWNDQRDARLDTLSEVYDNDVESECACGDTLQLKSIAKINELDSSLVEFVTTDYWLTKEPHYFETFLDSSEAIIDETTIDTLLCVYDFPITLEPAVSGIGYQWSDGSSDRELAVEDTGRYWVSTFLEGEDCAIHYTEYSIRTNDDLDLYTTDAIFCPDEDEAVISAGSGFDSYEWSFQDSTIAADRKDTVHEAGTYVVVVTEDHCTLEDSIVIESKDLPDASFGYSLNGLTVSFEVTNGAEEDFHRWAFGDGDFINVFDPMHTYDSAGVYSVVHQATNVCGTDRDTMDVNVLPLGTSSLEEAGPSVSWSGEKLRVLGAGKGFSFKLWNVSGQLVSSGQLKEEEIQLSASERGVLILQLSDGEDFWTYKLMLR